MRLVRCGIYTHMSRVLSYFQEQKEEFRRPVMGRSVVHILPSVALITQEKMKSYHQQREIIVLGIQVRVRATNVVLRV